MFIGLDMKIFGNNLGIRRKGGGQISCQMVYSGLWHWTISELLDFHHIAPPWCIMQVPLEIKNLMHVPQTVRSILEVTAGAISRGLSHACWEALWLQLTPWDLINLYENPLSATTLQELDVNKTNSTKTPALVGVSICGGVDCKRCCGLQSPESRIDQIELANLNCQYEFQTGK